LVSENPFRRLIKHPMWDENFTPDNQIPLSKMQTKLVRPCLHHHHVTVGCGPARACGRLSLLSGQEKGNPSDALPRGPRPIVCVHKFTWTHLVLSQHKYYSIYVRVYRDSTPYIMEHVTPYIMGQMEYTSSILDDMQLSWATSISTFGLQRCCSVLMRGDRSKPK
jgi:hypothetical protein